MTLRFNQQVFVRRISIAGVDLPDLAASAQCRSSTYRRRGFETFHGLSAASCSRFEAPFLLLQGRPDAC